MLSQAHPAASLYLWVGGSAFLVLFGLPLLIVPITWARLFRWWIPDDERLARYLGRSLGAVVVPLMGVLLRAAPTPERFPWLFELSAAICALLMLVHVVGAVERSQPWTETIEIGVYGLVGGLAFWIRTTL